MSDFTTTTSGESEVGFGLKFWHSIQLVDIYLN